MTIFPYVKFPDEFHPLFNMIFENNFFQFLFRAIIKQYSPGRPAAPPTRILLMIWWIFAIILTTAYESKLASFMIKAKNVEPNSAGELLDLNYDFLVRFIFSLS